MTTERQDTTYPCIPLIPNIRDASRRLVRELGFMHSTVAGTNLSPSAVHAMIEVGEHGVAVAADLAEILDLEKSTVSRMLKKLIEAGEMQENISARDGREKTLSLTTKGAQTLASINEYANTRIVTALRASPHDSCEAILHGIRTYADALRVGRVDPAATALTQPARTPVRIVSGYQIGIIARTIDMHMQFYPGLLKSNRQFERYLAKDLDDFFGRIDHPDNEVWAAVDGDNKIVGSVCIDGQYADLGGRDARLRTFIVDSKCQGNGVGGRLLKEAMAFVDARGFENTYLWTFKGLDAARKLYGRAGFVPFRDLDEKQWGEETTTQILVRKQNQTNST